MFSPLATPLSFAVILAFCVVTAFYAESLRLKDKLFYFLVSIPLFLVIIYSDDKSAMMILILALLAVGVFVERTIFIPVALALVIFFSGILDVRYLVERNVSFSEYAEFAKIPAEELSENKDIVIETSFFGSSLYEPAFNGVDSENSDSFFMTLIRQAGPPALLLFLWALFERVRESFFKRRRVTSPHARAYHLTVMLFIGAIVIGNLYGSIFDYPSIILAFWLVMGISEV